VDVLLQSQVCIYKNIEVITNRHSHYIIQNIIKHCPFTAALCGIPFFRSICRSTSLNQDNCFRSDKTAPLTSFDKVVSVSAWNLDTCDVAVILPGSFAIDDDAFLEDFGAIAGGLLEGYFG
jgi:hypothetical protein